MKNTNTKNAKKSVEKKSKKNMENLRSEGSDGLRELFVSELKDIYWAEKAMTTALTKMIEKSSSDELAKALSDHLEETEEHVTRLEEVFELIGEKPAAVKCEAMAGLIKEAESIMSEAEEGVVRDEGIISAGQKVEHYEIATYGTLATFAKTLGENEASDLLNVTLQEEKNADQALTKIAESLYSELTEDAYAEEAEEEEEETREDEE
jgi:ferritin-like metal-binding protein YciE